MLRKIQLLQSILSPAALVAACFFVQSFTSLSAQKIPIDTTRWYQLNYTTGNLNKLFDGDKNTVAFTGWNKILPNYEAYYPLRQGETMTIDSVRMYDKEGVFVNTPMTLYAIQSNWQRVQVARFTGETYNNWVGPYPTRPGVFKLDSAISDIRFLVLNIHHNDFPGEIELYGQYANNAAPVTTFTRQHVPLHHFFGINGFEWDFEDAVRPRVINETKMNAMKSFRGFRHYMDWEKIEEVEGRFLFNPVARGGWNYDTIYERCKQEGIEVLACLKTLPPWMINTYPENQREWDNNPVRYGAPLTEPSSYVEMARVAFQHIARYGYNKNVDTNLVSVYSVPKWHMDPVNEKKIGLGLIKYIECDNERDKWWKGRKGYMTGREYAANLSAFYDGHKNTLGPAVGVKNADSTVQVVMTGTASTSPDYLKGMIDWCREFRGYRPDGSVNLCWDVINYHLYSNDAGNSQSGSSNRGAAPEKSNCTEVADVMLQVSHEYSQNMPVWITELGFDIHQGSPLKAVPIGSKTALETQADWILRSSLLYSRLGLQKAFFYEVYDANVDAPYKFASSGLINKTDTTRKPAADFLYQTNKLFGDYTFQQTINADPIVDRYTRGGDEMYVLVVPDEVGRTANYQLALGTAQSAVIYTPQPGSNDMSMQVVNLVNGTLNIQVGETPLFVVPQANPTFVAAPVRPFTF